MEIDKGKMDSRKETSENTFPVIKIEVQDSPLKIDPALQSLVQINPETDMETTKDPAKQSAVLKRKRKRNRRKKRPNLSNDSTPAPELPKLMSCDEADDVSTMSLSGEHPGMENIVSVKKSRLKKRKRRKKVKQDSHDSKSFDSTSNCEDTLSKQLIENDEKLGDESEQAVCEVSLTKSNCEDKIVLLDVDVAKHVPLLEISHCSPKKAPVCRLKKKLLILDLNGLLADIVSPPPPREYKADKIVARRAIFKRPFCSDFLRFCFERFDVGIWSSRTGRNVDIVINCLMSDMKHKLLFCWDQSHCTTTSFKTIENNRKVVVFKELRKLWEKHDPNLPWEKGDYNESNTLLLDDSPYKALLNPPHTAIFPYSYKFHDANDNALDSGGDIRVYLEELDGAEHLQKYIEEHPFGQRAITERSSSWGFYLRVINSVRS